MKIKDSYESDLHVFYHEF
uniref:Uncharacterized protein n=1 Tax=Rhizophora mucronata TaxID=61149 RepID=A0A2P2NLT0_RHIMU